MSDRLLYELLDRVDRIQATLDQMTRQESYSNVEKLWLNKREFAHRIGMSVRWLEDRFPEGAPHRKVGSKVLINPTQFEAWMLSRGLRLDHIPRWVRLKLWWKERHTSW